MKRTTLPKTFVLALLLALSPHLLPAQTPEQLADMNLLADKDWTDTLDYGEWLLNAQFWIEHPDSEFARQFFAGLNLSPADDAAFRKIVADYTKQHDQLMAADYPKVDSPDWSVASETKLLTDLRDLANNSIQLLHSNLTPDGARQVDTAVLGTAPHTSLSEAPATN
jgi:hypothetical protein